MGRMLKKKSCTKKPSFFKVLIGDFEEKLRVPTDFIKHFNGKLPQKSILKSPTGRSWTIKVKKCGNDLFFSKGWHAFVNDHSLEYGDFLVFRYNGESRFNVKIYGRSGCEKEVHLNRVKPMSVVKKETHEEWMPNGENEKEETRKHVMEIEERSGAVVAASSIKTTSLHFDAIWNPNSRNRFMIPKAFAKKNGLKTKRTIVLEDPEGRSWPVDIYQREDGRVDMTKGWKTLCEGNRLADGDTCRFEFLNQRKGNKVSVRVFRKAEVEEPAETLKLLSNQPKAAHVTTRAEERAIKAASAFESENPFFTLIMRPSFVYEQCIMNVPAKFGKVYLMGKTQIVTFRVSDARTWQVRCSYSGTQTKLIRCSDFVSDNNLEVGDVCVFELVDRKKFEMNVSVFRVSEEVE